MDRKLAKLIWRLAIYVGLIPLAVIIACLGLYSPGKSPNSSLGNELSTYFYYVHTTVDEDLAQRSKNRTRDIEDKKLARFYRTWKWRRLPDPVDFRSEYYHTWSQIDSYGRIKPNYLKYWQTLRPYIQNLYANNLPKTPVFDPVVHFRCSDAPFGKFGCYHLSKSTTVKWMAAQIKQRGYNKIILLSCNKHKAGAAIEQQSCATYSDYYVEIFKQSGVQVTTRCGSIYDDFVLMVNSPLLVSLNGSSFSFMAGIGKDPQNYISSNLGVEHEGTYYLQTAADWSMDMHTPLLHKDVKDYTVTQDVLKQLSE